MSFRSQETEQKAKMCRTSEARPVARREGDETSVQVETRLHKSAPCPNTSASKLSPMNYLSRYALYTSSLYQNIKYLSTLGIFTSTGFPHGSHILMLRLHLFLKRTPSLSLVFLTGGKCGISALCIGEFCKALQ